MFVETIGEHPKSYNLHTKPMMSELYRSHKVSSEQNTMLAGNALSLLHGSATLNL